MRISDLCETFLYSHVCKNKHQIFCSIIRQSVTNLRIYESIHTPIPFTHTRMHTSFDSGFSWPSILSPYNQHHKDATTLLEPCGLLLNGRLSSLLMRVAISFEP